MNDWQRQFNKKFKDYPGGLYKRVNKSIDIPAHGDEIKRFICGKHKRLLNLIERLKK